MSSRSTTADSRTVDCRSLMRATLTVLVLLGAACSANGPATREAPPMTGLDPERVREMATRYTAAWCSQDPARVASFFARDGSLRVNDADPAVGRDAIADVARGFMTAFPDMRVLMDDVVIDGERVVYRWTLVGTNTGPGGTGRPVRIGGFEEWRLADDGLIAASLGHFDAADYRRQLDGQ